MAKSYQNLGLPLADLISEGNLGLITAARRFDGTKGYKFISYAVWWIRQAIRQALAEQPRLVRLPLNRLDQLHRLDQAATRLAQRLGRPAKTDELANEVDMAPDQLARLWGLDQASLSLDAPLDEQATQGHGDVLADTSLPRQDDQLWEEGLEQALETALDTLSEREAQVVRQYYGLQGDVPRTLEAIGAQLGCTRERVRQLKEQALYKLRHPTRNAPLRAYYRDLKELDHWVAV